MDCCCRLFEDWPCRSQDLSAGRNRNVVAMGGETLFAWVLFRDVDFGPVGLLEAALLALRWLVAWLVIVQVPVCSRCERSSDAHVHSLCLSALKVSLLAAPRCPALSEC